MIQRYDEKEAITSGVASKNLTTKDIEKHFADFGIFSEEASHTLIKSLSGGQKVWQNPHLIILDEPTNYLDRDGLGALTNAIHEFEGGIVIISHNKEFTDAVSQEKWIMDKGLLRKEGESIDTTEDVAPSFAADDVVVDGFGNVITIDKQNKLTAKEKKKAIKLLHKKISDAKKKRMSDDVIYEFEMQLEDLLEEQE